MDSLDFPFTIEIDGTPIASVSDADKDNSRVQAKTGSNAAVLTLKDNRLQSGEWVLGRNTAEDRSLLPKQIFWFKASEGDLPVQPVTAHQDGDAYELRFNNNACLIAEESNIFAGLMGDGQCQVVVKRREQ